jgi:cytoskeletal protein CcmA (bactofilin family)
MSFFTGRRHNETESEVEKATSSHVGFDTVLSASTVLEGTLKSEGNIRLDGQFSGKLDIIGNVLVGETAEIDADIEARNISIAGIVRGNVTGNKVQLLRTGRIWGDIKSNSLTTEEGAFIEGKVAMNANVPVPIVEEVKDEAAQIEDETIASADDNLEQTLPDLSDASEAVNDADEAE